MRNKKLLREKSTFLKKKKIFYIYCSNFHVVSLIRWYHCSKGYCWHLPSNPMSVNYNGRFLWWYNRKKKILKPWMDEWVQYVILTVMNLLSLYSLCYYWHLSYNLYKSWQCPSWKTTTRIYIFAEAVLRESVQNKS